MPIYEYRCDNGHTFEAMQKMTDDPLSSCEQCGAPVQRVFHPVAVHFKGSGFYTTDYGSKKTAGDGDKPKSSEESKEKKSEKKTEKKETAKSESSD